MPPRRRAPWRTCRPCTLKCWRPRPLLWGPHLRRQLRMQRRRAPIMSTPPGRVGKVPHCRRMAVVRGRGPPRNIWGLPPGVMRRQGTRPIGPLHRGIMATKSRSRDPRVVVFLLVVPEGTFAWRGWVACILW